MSKQRLSKGLRQILIHSQGVPSNWHSLTGPIVKASWICAMFSKTLCLMVLEGWIIPLLIGKPLTMMPWLHDCFFYYPPPSPHCHHHYQSAILIILITAVFVLFCHHCSRLTKLSAPSSASWSPPWSSSFNHQFGDAHNPQIFSSSSSSSYL